MHFLMTLEFISYYMLYVPVYSKHLNYIYASLGIEFEMKTIV